MNALEPEKAGPFIREWLKRVLDDLNKRENLAKTKNNKEVLNMLRLLRERLQFLMPYFENPHPEILRIGYPLLEVMALWKETGPLPVSYWGMRRGPRNRGSEHAKWLDGNLPGWLEMKAPALVAAAKAKGRSITDRYAFDLLKKYRKLRSTTE